VEMADSLMLRLTALPASPEASALIADGLREGSTVVIYFAVGVVESILAFKMRASDTGVDLLDADDRRLGSYPDALAAMKAGEAAFRAAGS